MSLIPENFADWRMEICRLPGRYAVTARRNGVTLMLVHKDDWWTITKWHKGQVLADKTIKTLPPETMRVLVAAERRQNDGRRQHLAPGARR